MNEHKPTCNEVLDNIHHVYNILENMSSMYDIEKTTLKEFLRDVKQAHALHMYLTFNYQESK